MSKINYNISAKETEYQGRLFRSRLEARWAAFFDLCGWNWEYEPFDLEGWSPDFIIYGLKDILVEVKPINIFDGEIVLKLNRAHPNGTVFLLGCSFNDNVIGWARDDEIEYNSILDKVNNDFIKSNKIRNNSQQLALEMRDVFKKHFCGCTKEDDCKISVNLKIEACFHEWWDISIGIYKPQNKITANSCDCYCHDNNGNMTWGDFHINLKKEEMNGAEFYRNFTKDEINILWQKAGNLTRFRYKKRVI